MSFDRELRVVMISALGILAYLLASTAAAYAIHQYFGMTAFLVSWLVVLLIPLNFAICSLTCIAFYKRKEKSFNEIKEQLHELSDMTFELDKKRDDKITVRPIVSAEAM